MQYLESLPSLRLRPFVKCYWSLKQASDGTALTEPVIPDGCSEIVFNLEDRFKRYKICGEVETQPTAIFVGQMRRHVMLQPTGNVYLFGIRFHPAGAFPFFDFSFDELTDRIVPLSDVLGCKTVSIQEKLNKCSDFFSMASTVNAEMERLLKRESDSNNIADIACGLIAVTKGAFPVVSISAKLGLSERHLERRFRERVGLSPKAFARIQRFQFALRRIKAERDIDLLDLALSAGYYDQSHFIKDFKDFSGQTPLEFIRAEQQMSEVFIT